MIAIFLNQVDAQKLADKIHTYLQANCPNYNAICWQVPVKHDKLAKWYVQVPQEYYKEYYVAKEKITVAIDTEIKKASVIQEKPEPDWSPVAAKIES